MSGRSILRRVRLHRVGRVLLWAFHFVRARCVTILNLRAVLLFLSHRRRFRLTTLERQWLATLRRDGFVVIEDLFDDAHVAGISRQVDSLLSDPGNVDRTNANAYNHERKLRLDRPLVRIPELSGLVFNETICRLASAYKGFVPIHLFNVYRTLPGDRLEGSSCFHRDDLGDMSVFVYLHDVDEHCGASFYVRGSHGYTLDSFSLLSNYEKQVDDPNTAYADEEVERHYPRARWMRLQGKRGTVVILDVTGIHKGPFWDLGDARNAPRSVVHMVFRQRNLFRSGYVPDRSAPSTATPPLGPVGQLVFRQYAQ
jgi:hypothetical protein